MGIATRVAARFAAKARWRGNKAEGKHTTAEVSKGAFGWAWEVTTNFKRTLRTGTKTHIQLETDGTVYKADAKEAAEEALAKWDREIRSAGGPEKWLENW